MPVSRGFAQLFTAAWHHEAAAVIQRQVRGWRSSSRQPGTGWRSNQELEMRNARLVKENRELRAVNATYNPEAVDAAKRALKHEHETALTERDALQDELDEHRAAAQGVESEVVELRLRLKEADADATVNRAEITRLRFRVGTGRSHSHAGAAAGGSLVEQAAKAAHDSLPSAPAPSRAAALRASMSLEASSASGGDDSGAAGGLAGGDNDVAEGTWRLEGWLKSLDLSQVVAKAFLPALHKRSKDPRLERAFAARLGRRGDAHVVASMLRETALLEQISDAIASAAGELHADKRVEENTATAWAEATKPPPSLGKFVEEFPSEEDGGPGRDASGGRKLFTLTFGDASDFVGGLGKLVGEPMANRPRLLGMREDHCSAADSTEDFEVSNYGTRTTSQIEWWFVVEPTAERLAALKREEWPVDTKLRSDPEMVDRCRQPRPLSSYAVERAAVNGRLRALHSELFEEEFIGARLYTGPNFLKYNTVLRGVHGKVPFFHQKWRDLCKDNKYTTTMHVISAALGKLSLLVSCQKVYRGMSGGALPESFRKPDALNFRGGIEFGFMSTVLPLRLEQTQQHTRNRLLMASFVHWQTTNRAVAVEYAQGDGGIVFEISMGFVDKGAELGWLSQYPHENEICFPPLTGLAVHGTRVEGSALLLDLLPRIKMLHRGDDAAADAYYELFMQADRDGSHSLDADEFARVVNEAQRRAKRPAHPRAVCDAVFRAMDVDGSGTLSLAEFSPEIVRRELDRAAAEAEAQRAQRAAESAGTVRIADEQRQEREREARVRREVAAASAEAEDRVKRAAEESERSRDEHAADAERQRASERHHAVMASHRKLVEQSRQLDATKETARMAERTAGQERIMRERATLFAAAERSAQERVDRAIAEASAKADAQLSVQQQRHELQVRGLMRQLEAVERHVSQRSAAVRAVASELGLAPSGGRTVAASHDRGARGEKTLLARSFW